MMYGLISNVYHFGQLNSWENGLLETKLHHETQRPKAHLSYLDWTVMVGHILHWHGETIHSMPLLVCLTCAAS